MKGEVGGVIADEICFPNVHKDGNLKTKKKNSYTDFKNSQFLWIKKILFFFFFVFLGPHPRHMEVPTLEVKSEL